jgi:hypothetical protein
MTVLPSLSAPPRLKRSLVEYGAVVGLTLLSVFLLYGPRWLAGLSLFRGVVQEQYYLLGQYAFDQRIVADFGRGYFPLWNPMNGLGTPLLGNMLSGVFYPLKLIVYLFPGLAARDFYLVLRLLLAALGAFALGRRMRLSFFPAAVAALAFALTGYMKMFVNENYLNADVLLPVLVLVTLRLRSRTRLIDLLALAGLVFAVLNNGHPEAAFYTLLLPAVVCVAAARGKAELGAGALRWATGFGLGLALSLPLLLPFVEYWARGDHFHVPGAGFFHYSARQAVALVTPWLFGRAPAGAAFVMRPEIVWSEGLAGLPGYAATAAPWLAPALGALPLYLALVAAGKLARLTRVEVALAAYAVFFLGVMFGLPLFRLVGFLPVFNFSGNFKHPEPGVALACALLAGRGLELILTGRIGARRAAYTLAGLVGAVLLLGLVTEPLAGGARYLNRYALVELAVLIAAGAGLAWFLAVAPPARRNLEHAGGTPTLQEDEDAGGPPALQMMRFVAGLVALAALVAGLVLDGYQQPMRDPAYEARLAGSAGSCSRRTSTSYSASPTSGSWTGSTIGGWWPRSTASTATTASRPAITGTAGSAISSPCRTSSGTRSSTSSTWATRSVPDRCRSTGRRRR